MAHDPKVTEVIEKLKTFLRSDSTKASFRASDRDFSRKSGKLDFCGYALLGVSLLKGSLASDLYNVLSGSGLPHVTKSAYSQGRYKIKPSFYQAWSAELVSSARLAGLSGACWRGYGLVAVDGTGLVLPQTKGLSEAFGSHKSGTKKWKKQTVMAKCLIEADLLNQYVTHCEVFGTGGSELGALKGRLWALSPENIAIMDRGFASAAVFGHLVRHGRPFVCRLKAGFNKAVAAFAAGPAGDAAAEFAVNKAEAFPDGRGGADRVEKGDKVPLRLVKVALPSGAVEVLATNLTEAGGFSADDLGRLYHLRWGVETCIGSLKNQFLCMVFSGVKREAVLQDMYAAAFAHNLRQLLANEAQRLSEAAVKPVKPGKPTPHPQQVNRNVALGVLKPKIMPLFLSPAPSEIIKSLILIIMQNKISVIKEKPKPKRAPSLAKRRNLVVQMNYRRAI